MLLVQIHLRHFNLGSSVHLSVVVVFSSPALEYVCMYLTYFDSQHFYPGSDALPRCSAAQVVLPLCWQLVFFLLACEGAFTRQGRGRAGHFSHSVIPKASWTTFSSATLLNPSCLSISSVPCCLGLHMAAFNISLQYGRSYQQRVHTAFHFLVADYMLGLHSVCHLFLLQ